MNTLHVLHDADYPAGLRICEWLARQEAIIPLLLHAHQAPETACQFPGIAAHLTPRELTVVGDDGQVWTGPSAAVICLFALEEYRDLAERLAQPALLPLARTALDLLSREVFEMTCLLRRSTPADLEELLRLNAEGARRRFHLPPALPVVRV